VWRISGHEIRLVANPYKFLKPGELFANPKAHAVYEYYWPLATSKSFDSHPGTDGPHRARGAPAHRDAGVGPGRALFKGTTHAPTPGDGSAPGMTVAR
jgi:hypothetical protein